MKTEGRALPWVRIRHRARGQVLDKVQEGVAGHEIALRRQSVWAVRKFIDTVNTGNGKRKQKEHGIHQGLDFIGRQLESFEVVGWMSDSAMECGWIWAPRQVRSTRRPSATGQENFHLYS